MLVLAESSHHFRVSKKNQRLLNILSGSERQRPQEGEVSFMANNPQLGRISSPTYTQQTTKRGPFFSLLKVMSSHLRSGQRSTSLHVQSLEPTCLGIFWGQVLGRVASFDAHVEVVFLKTMSDVMSSHSVY